MRRWIRLRVLPVGLATAFWTAVLAGCGQNSMFVQDQLKQVRERQVTLERQYEQLQTRTTTLDRDNQDLGTLLAQARQQTQARDEQLAALRDELSDATTKLAQARQERDASENRARAMTASLQRQGGVTIMPNRSIQAELPTVTLPGIDVRRDGDVVRIALPAERLFEPGTARLRPGAPKVITYVAGELLRVYPRQMIGIEGHVDGAMASAGNPSAAQETSIAWATAVHQVLVSQTRLVPTQLFITGHGANHPMYSNASPDGQQLNRRIELVVYPDRMGP